VSGLPSGWARSGLADLGAEVRVSISPEAGKTYELYSVPAFANGIPETLDGSEIGSAKRAVEPNDVLLCKINPRINRVWVVGEGHGLSQIASPEYLIFRTSEPDLAHYLRWYLSSPSFREWIKLSVEGMTGSHTRAKSGPILRQRVLIPPLAEQRRIVAAIEEHLSRLDAAAVSLLMVQQKLRALRTAAFGNALRGSWPMKPLGEIAQTKSGGTPSRKHPHYFGGEIPWVKSGELRDGVVERTEETISELGLRESSAKVFKRGTLLIALYGATVGKLGVLDIDAATNQAVCAVVPNDDLLMRYLWIVLRANRTRLVAAGQGGAQPNISQAILRRLQVPVPPVSEQRRIVAEVERHISQLDAMSLQVLSALRRAESLRRVILASAFRGELVPQDPNDEQASVLLERIAAERAAAPQPKRERREKAPA
jgi:type I restriction enzyme, S subunit